MILDPLILESEWGNEQNENLRRPSFSSFPAFFLHFLHCSVTLGATHCHGDLQQLGSPRQITLHTQ